MSTPQHDMIVSTLGTSMCTYTCRYVQISATSIQFYPHVARSLQLWHQAPSMEGNLTHYNIHGVALLLLKGHLSAVMNAPPLPKEELATHKTIVSIIKNYHPNT